PAHKTPPCSGEIAAAGCQRAQQYSEGAVGCRSEPCGSPKPEKRQQRHPPLTPYDDGRKPKNEQRYHDHSRVSVMPQFWRARCQAVREEDLDRRRVRLM